MVWRWEQHLHMKKDAVKRKEIIYFLPVTETTKGKHQKGKNFGQALGRSFLIES